jgi:hypothetical protein
VATHRAHNPKIGGSNPSPATITTEITMGKGSSPRPFSIPLKDFNNKFDAIFRKDNNEKKDTVNNDNKFNTVDQEHEFKKPNMPG